MATTMVHVRIDREDQGEMATKALAGMGISGSRTRCAFLLVRVAAEKALPFEVRVPNATTTKGDARRG